MRAPATKKEAAYVKAVERMLEFGNRNEGKGYSNGKLDEKLLLEFMVLRQDIDRASDNLPDSTTIADVYELVGHLYA